MTWELSQDLCLIFFMLLGLVAIGWLLSAVAEAIRNARMRREEYRSYLFNRRIW